MKQTTTGKEENVTITMNRESVTTLILLHSSERNKNREVDWNSKYKQKVH